MSDLKLHEGIWTRQLLKGKKLVRVAFIPDKLTDPLQSTKIKNDENSKIAWQKLLGDNLDFDINLGVLIVRFNPDGKSGIALFLSQLTDQPEIVNTFQQSEQDFNGPVGGSGEFISCINNKKNLLGFNFNLPLAFNECLPQLSI